MSEQTISPDVAGDTEQTPVAPEQPYLCERCGQFKARYVVADLEEADTSLFCGGCIVVTFAMVASEIGQAQS